MSNKIKEFNVLVNAKIYQDVIEHLATEGHKFSDIQLAVSLVSFIYNKTPEQIRKDLWDSRGSSVVER